MKLSLDYGGAEACAVVSKPFKIDHYKVPWVNLTQLNNRDKHIL